MSIIIKLQGLPLEANSVDVRLYFLGLTIPDGGVHIIGGDEGTVFIEFANDEDARQAMARGVGTIKDSNVKLLLSSRSEMQSVIDSVRQKHQQTFQQQHQHNHQQQQQPQPEQPQQQQNQPPQQQFQQPILLSQVPPQPWFNVSAPAPVPLLPWVQPVQQPPPPQQQQPPQLQQSPQPPRPSLLHPNQTLQPHDQQLQQQTQQQQHYNQNSTNRARGMSGMRGGDDKLFADKRCVLAASNIPYRATSKDIIEFLSDFDIREECIRRRYNQKGQPTADAKIAFPSQEAAMKALKMMNKKTICGRQVFLKPV